MDATEQRNRRTLFGNSLMVGAIFTAGFYTLVSLPFFSNTALPRYTTGHPVEYITVALFFWALADLLLKCIDIGRERRALAYEWLPPYTNPQPITSAVELFGQLHAGPRRLAETYLGRRLRKAVHYVREKRSTDGLEEQLRYLADLDADLSHASFAKVRVIAWMIPILGFLGTVIGITLAIANVTPSQLESSLNEVTGGLAVAFDTTAVALSLSMLLMFANFLVERAEQSILHRVETHSHEQLSHRFLRDDPVTAPYLRAVQATGERVVEHTAVLVEKQIELWNQSLGAVAQQYEVTHRQVEERLLRVLDSLSAERTTYVASMENCARQMGELQERLIEMSRHLASLAGGETQLAATQDRLAENLKLLQQTRGLDEAVHSLTAAIHLLTIRHRPTDSTQGEAA